MPADNIKLLHKYIYLVLVLILYTLIPTLYTIRFHHEHSTTTRFLVYRSITCSTAPRFTRKRYGGGDGGELRQTVLREHLVVGHCCESSDIFTPDITCEDGVGTRMLLACTIGDYVVIEWCCAYCESMSAKGYNGFEGLGLAWVE